MTNTPAGWEGILQPGETIVWQGRPDQHFIFTPRIPVLLMGIFVCGFSLFWMATAFAMTWGEGLPGQAMPLFGMIFLYQSLKMVGGHDLWDCYVRRNTWYTLTTQRAFIASRILGRKSLKSWAIENFRDLDYEYGPPSHVWFATQTRGKTRKRIGFRHLDDAHEVHGLIRDLKKDQPA